MADNYLITGYHGAPHVTAEDDRGIQAGMMGKGRYVLDVGEKFRAEYIGNNTVRMYDGKLLDNGAAAGIPAGEYVDLVIGSASQGIKRNDLIVFEYSKDASTLIEAGTFKVVRGVDTTGTATDPTLEQNDLLSGNALIDQMPLWRVAINGATISAPVQVFELSENTRTHTHSADDISGGVIPVKNGGTNAKTAKAAEYNISGGIQESDESINDNTQIVLKRTSPSASAGVFAYKAASTLWAWIASKIRSVFGFSSANVLPLKNGGTNATTAATAREALEITPANIGAAEAEHTHAVADVEDLPEWVKAEDKPTYTPAEIGIVYSETQPDYVEGRIWLKPV